jgi:prephenate dehydrogenase
MFTQNQSNFTNFGVIGLGLIGGSLVKALRCAYPEAIIEVADVNQAAVKAAIDEGAATRGVDIATLDFHNCEVLFLCTPPRIVCELLSRIDGERFGIITDVASVKAPVMAAASALTNFVGGHPMAGSEGSGYSSAEEGLFKNARWVLSVPENCAVPGNMLAMLTKLIRTLGAEAILMDAVEHDRRVAMISHLPHVAAFALSEIVANTNDTAMKQLIGGGFKDTTRIAASSPSLWTDIFSESSELIPSLEEYIKHLEDYLALLKHSELQGIKARLITAAEFRRSIPEGLRAKSHLDIEGEAK